jgi:DNA-binding response OmpR family regulator
MLIDDEKQILDLYQAYCRRIHSAGVELTLLDTTFEGISKFLAEPLKYDAVVTDLNQHPTGVDVVKAVRSSLNPSIPLYIITGGVTGPKGHILEQNAVDLVGPQRYFVKPLVMGSLCKLVYEEARQIRDQRHLLAKP